MLAQLEQKKQKVEALEEKERKKAEWMEKGERRKTNRNENKRSNKRKLRKGKEGWTKGIESSKFLSLEIVKLVLVCLKERGLISRETSKVKYTLICAVFAVFFTLKM